MPPAKNVARSARALHNLAPPMRTPRAILTLLLLPFALLPARAGQLPARSYSTADGLAHERVRCVVRDSRGFLWLCKGDGLSRFDGYGFTNYGVREGLAQPAVNQIAEGRGGVYWLGTTAGVALFDPAAGRRASGVAADPPAPVSQDTARSRFTFFRVGDEEPSNRVQTLVEDRAGRVWAGTVGGLFYADAAHDGRRVFRRLELPAHEPPFVNALLEDAGAASGPRPRPDSSGARPTGASSHTRSDSRAPPRTAFCSTARGVCGSASAAGSRSSGRSRPRI